jgi:hypothetical protein
MIRQELARVNGPGNALGVETAATMDRKAFKSELRAALRRQALGIPQPTQANRCRYEPEKRAALELWGAHVAALPARPVALAAAA